MSRARLCWALLLTLVVPATAVAQGTIQGSVVNATTMQPLSGAQVSVPGLNVGTLTNAQGRFQLVNVPAGARAVRVNLIGYTQVERTVTVPSTGIVTLDVILEPTALALEGVVVTALGVERQARALGVAAQQVTEDQITRLEPNIVNTLSGKVSGVQIRNAGPQGGSSRIVIRGASSITGNNQPIFVIDGVPIDNSGPRLRGYGGYDYGNAAQDLNPDDIEAITVLKGPNAAALYGSRASNGAILITTKSGRSASGGQITASQMVTFEDPLRLPDYQDQFGQGVFGVFSFVDGNGGGVYDYFDESWGPPLDGRMVAQFNSPIDPATGKRTPTPWVARPDNVRNFFETGRTLTTNVAFAAASDQANARVSLSRQALDGMVPAHEQERITLGLSGGIQLSERFRVEASGQYVNNQGEQRPGIGYELSNPMIQFVWFGRQVDVADLRQNWDTRRPEGDPQAGEPYSWNYRYHPNPYYIRFANTNEDVRDRLIGQVSASYDVLPWLNAMVRTGTDYYRDDRTYTYAQDLFGMSGFDPTVGFEHHAIGQNGAFGRWGIGFQETNVDALLTATPQLELPFTVTASLGANRRNAERNTDITYVSDITAPGVYSFANRAADPQPYDFLSRRRVNSLYGQTEIGFNNYFFLTFTGRNDWSSTLPEDNRSYFYPSVSGSFVFSDFFTGLQDSPLNYGKVRASWAEVGNDTDPFALRNTFSANDPFMGVPRFALPNTLANAELRPESTESVELGTELGFLDGRVGLDLTWYRATTSDQIMPVQVSRASGFTGQWINAGAVRNEGVEALLSVTPVRTRDFQWNTRINFGKNENTVVRLTEGVEGLQLPGGSYWGVTVFARGPSEENNFKGEPYGQIMGRKYLRNGNGDIIIDQLGRPMRTAGAEVIGNYNPDWTGGLANTLSYRGLSLDFLIDTQQGGDVYSVTHMFGRYAGVTAETLEGRCRRPNWPVTEGLPVCNSETGIVVPGVQIVSVAGSDTTFAQNTQWVDAQSYNWSLYNTHEAHIFDASYFKLREVNLGYSLPTSLTNRLRVSGLNVALVGRNLALWGTNVPHIDPETAFDASNVQGLEFGQLPTARSIGFNVSVRP